MCDSASVFHGACVEFWNEELIVFVEWISSVERIFKISETLFRYSEQFLWIKILSERLSTEKTKWVCAICSDIFIPDFMVRTSHNGSDVGRHEFSGRESPLRCAIAKFRWCGRMSIANDFPVIRGGNCEGVHSLLIRLIKTSEHAPCIGNFKLAVQIRFAIFGIDESVEAFTSIHVGAFTGDYERVFALQFIQGNSEAIVCGKWQVHPVEQDRGNGWCNEIDPS